MVVSPAVRAGLCAGVLVLAAGCGGSSSTGASATTAASTPASTAASPTAAAAATYHVAVDGNKPEAGLPVTESFLAYYPKALSVHPGDTVEFGLADSGEPHSVVLGGLVDKVVALAKTLKPNAPPPPAAVAAMNKVPKLLPDGPGDAIQAGAQPCFQATGLPSTKAACSVKTGEFTGAEALVGSGWLASSSPFSLKISAAAKPGKYNFYCQLHGPDMGGTLTVADAAGTIPTPSEADATGLAELKADAAKLAPTVSQLQSAPVTKAAAGGGSQAFQQGIVDAFGPAEVKIPVGGSVTWTVFGPHTIYFNAPADAQQLRQAAPDGSVHLNPKAVMPVGGPGSGPKPGLVDGGSWNGVGPRSSGIILSFPPTLSSYKLRFTKAGSYTFMCTIHEKMKGQVTVA